ncbi:MULTISPECIES: choline-binding transcriptional repressor BetI [unclassified Meridianimarinicoccus]|uniref:choline-binding transcriptional repressor BetI n=1 Tax=unclassified Meridianimarinicoccus TaxID=2923344 RepID=UPI00186834AE|nr:transcriptional regulator BetI [Fluviibacterium sp. MJW13]
MPKLGMEPIRRQTLVAATIAEIGAAGSLEVTMSQIARRAGVSSALAHHYFGSKDKLFLAAMRTVLTDFGTEAREALAGQTDPQARLRAIVQTCFAPASFRPGVVAAWLNFYVHALNSDATLRLLRLYRRRLHSNLVHDLRPLVGAQAEEIAETTGALIDGLYIRQALKSDGPLADAAVRHVMAYLDLAIAAGSRA